MPTPASSGVSSSRLVSKLLKVNEGNIPFQTNLKSVLPNSAHSHLHTCVHTTKTQRQQAHDNGSKIGERPTSTCIERIGMSLHIHTGICLSRRWMALLSVLQLHIIGVHTPHAHSCLSTAGDGICDSWCLSENLPWFREVWRHLLTKLITHVRRLKRGVSSRHMSYATLPALRCQVCSLAVCVCALNHHRTTSETVKWIDVSVTSIS